MSSSKVKEIINQPVQGPVITIYDNGKPVGTESLGPDNNWVFFLNNLTEGLHIMEAQIGGKTSESWHVTKAATSGSEDWSTEPDQDLKRRSFYILPSGLIILSIEGLTRIAMNDAGKKVLALSDHSEFFILLPVAASQITVTFDGTMDHRPLDQIMFGAPGAAVIPGVKPSKPGDTVYNFEQKVQSIAYYRYRDPDNTDSMMHISKISWNTPT